jgi:uncharacterized LabA/DUF88 family protein
LKWGSKNAQKIQDSPAVAFLHFGRTIPCMKLKNDSDSVAVFIDASNVWQAQKVKGLLFDYEKLQKFLRDMYAPRVVRIFYYTAYPREGTRDYSLANKHSFYTYLKKGLGFIVRKKELKRIVVHSDEGDYFEEKGNMDVEMTIDAMHNRDTYSAAVFFSGDSDFLALVTYLRSRGKKVYVFSSKNNISYELKTGADGYKDILEITEDIWGRELQRRTQKG